MEQLDSEFSSIVPRINLLMENSLKTNHEKKKLKLWLDKLVLENDDDEKTKSTRNEFAHYLEDFISKKGTIPGICYKGPPEGKLPPLRQLIRGGEGNDDTENKARREGKLMDFTQEAGCHGKSAYDETYEVMKRYKQQLDNCIRGRLQKLAAEERDATEYEIQCFNSETNRLRDYFKQCEKEIMELVPNFNWSEYREKPDSYFRETFQQCPPKPTTEASECQIKRIQESINRTQVENQILEDKLDKVRCEVAAENCRLDEILNDNDYHLERVQSLKMRIDTVDDMMSAIVKEMEEYT